MPSEELPVKVEASLAIQSLITNQTQKGSLHIAIFKLEFKRI